MCGSCSIPGNAGPPSTPTLDFGSAGEDADLVRVLITTSYYWPEGAGSAPYLTGLAEHLSEVGHDVVVATSFAHYPDVLP